MEFHKVSIDTRQKVVSQTATLTYTPLLHSIDKISIEVKVEPQSQVQVHV
jgi:hypothetical protein